MKTFPALLVAMTITMTLGVPAAEAAGGAPKPPGEMAANAYNGGLAQRDRAARFEEEAATADDGDARAAATRRARKSWERAVRKYNEALRHDDTLYEAHSALGYALRKLGRYDEALVAYDRALALNPEYVPAIEYRGEAYLALGRLEDAKAAYVTLEGRDAEQASQLMSAMQRWAAAQGGDGALVDGEQLAAFRAWMSERAPTQAPPASAQRTRRW